MDPFGVDPDVFGGLTLLALLALLVGRALGWTRFVPGLEELLGGRAREED